MKESEKMRPLQGIQVVDFSRRLPGPFCTWLLAELGARVVRIEAPSGDPLRRVPPLAAEGDVGVQFEVIHHGKETLVLDLKQPEDRARARQIITESNVMVESFRAGIPEQFGLDEPAVRALRPDIIYLSLPGFARSTSEGGRAVHDLNALARSGFLGLEASRVGELTLPLRPWADLWSGMMAALQVAAALAGQRWHAGEMRDGFDAFSEDQGMHAYGAFLEVPLVEGVLPVLASYFRQSALAGHVKADEGFRTTSGMPCYNVYRCLDGRWLALGAMEKAAWERFCQLMGRPDWSGRGQEGTAEGAMAAEIGAVFSIRTSDEWMDLLGPANVCCERVQTPEEVLRDPYYLERGCFDEEGFVRLPPVKAGGKVNAAAE